jgi:hypothetical protein
VGHLEATSSCFSVFRQDLIAEIDKGTLKVQVKELQAEVASEPKVTFQPQAVCSRV